MQVNHHRMMFPCFHVWSMTYLGTPILTSLCAKKKKKSVHIKILPLVWRVHRSSKGISNFGRFKGAGFPVKTTALFDKKRKEKQNPLQSASIHCQMIHTSRPISVMSTSKKLKAGLKFLARRQSCEPTQRVNQTHKKYYVKLYNYTDVYPASTQSRY